MAKKKLIKTPTPTSVPKEQPKKTFWQAAGAIFIGMLVVLYILQIVLHGVGYKYNKQAGFVKSTDYETEHGYEIIETNNRIKIFYENDWDLAKALEDVKATRVIFDSENLNHSMTTYLDNGLYADISCGDENEEFDAKLNVINDNLYMYLNAKDKSENLTTYIHAVYNESDNMPWNIDVILTPISTINTLASAEEFSVIYNCRTKIDDIEYDDVLVRTDVFNIVRLLVNPDTGKVMRIITPCYNNDYTEVLYDAPLLSNMDFKNIIEYNGEPNVKLPDGNMGNTVTTDEFYIISDSIVRMCTNDVVKLISDDIYDAIESEVNNSVK